MKDPAKYFYALVSIVYIGAGVWALWTFLKW